MYFYVYDYRANTFDLRALCARRTFDQGCVNPPFLSQRVEVCTCRKNGVVYEEATFKSRAFDSYRN